MAEPPKFMVDAMLGKLARWLRTMGLDVAYDTKLDDWGLLRRALAEERGLLTRDRHLAARRAARRHLLIRSDHVEEQVRQVVEELGLVLDPQRFFGRCVECNAVLEPLATAAARERVPPFVAATQKRFLECPSCHRIFWQATHVARMKERLRRAGILPVDE